MTIIDLDIFRNARLIVEHHSVDGMTKKMTRWTLTGEKKDVVERAASAIIMSVNDGDSSFNFPARIIDANARYGWYRMNGYTTETEQEMK